MKKAFTALLTVALSAALFAGGRKDGGAAASAEAEISARAAIGRLEGAAPFFEGDGGKDIRLAVLEPEAQGLSAEEAYLPVYIQGLLNSNFSKYSAIALIDRQNLNRILVEQDITLSGRFSDEDLVSISDLANAQYLLVGILQKMRGNQYAVQLAVTDFRTGVRRATFMANGTAAQLENGSLVNEAGEALLDQLGVRLTAAGKAALSQGRAAASRAEAGFAKGVAAEQSGAQVEALFNYTQSVAFDPSKLEALTRLNTVSQEIRGNTISANILNDIEARRSWLGALKRATAFFNEHPPFEIIFDPNLIQEGETDYAREQVNLAMRIAVEPSEAGFAALNALLAGLENTGKRAAWGFAGWPLRDIEPKTEETVLFRGNRSLGFKVEIALVNERGKTIAESGVTLTSEGLDFAAGGKAVIKPSSDMALVRFRKVDVKDLTPVLNVVIREVNGIKGKSLNKSGYIAIGAGNLEAFARAEMGFVWIPPGTFSMGGSDEKPVHPVHQVTISKGFYMSDHEVTQKEWMEIMGTTVRQQRDTANKSWSLYGEGDNHPMYYVNWHEALEYCYKRCVKEGLTPAYSGSGDSITWDKNANGYRLPTEAEWEWAARGGGKGSMSYEYSGSGSVDAAAWYSGNSGSMTHPVKTKGANSLGLYDMSGNVWEWCWDRYGGYDSGAQTDPTGASSGTNRVLRGGSWYRNAGYVRVAYRSGLAPSYRDGDLGFRLVRP